MEPYYKWTVHFSDFAFYDILRATPSLSLSQRKTVLTYCRVQPSMLSGSRFENRIGTDLDSIVCIRCDKKPTQNQRPQYTGEQIPLRVLLNNVSPDPVTCAIVSAAVIAAPYYDWSDAIQAGVDTRIKEEAAGIAINFINMNYSSWLGASWYGSTSEIPLYEELGPHPATARMIADVFRHTKKQIEGARLYPDIKKKTFGRDAAHEVNLGMTQLHGYTHLDGTTSVETHRDLEEVYHHTGIMLQGRTEMRSAWKYNDFKPRCYYAMGPTHYFASRYIQSVFNTLVDAFPMCHRKQRFSIPRYNIWGQNIRTAIYDYSSFTSSLTEIYRFTQALGEYFQDTHVYFLDTWKQTTSVCMM